MPVKRRPKRHTQIDRDSDVVWYVVLSNINNEIACFYESVWSFLVILIVIENVKARICATSSVSFYGSTSKGANYLATSAYVSMAFIFFLLVSAIGNNDFRTASRSGTLTKVSFRKVLR